VTMATERPANCSARVGMESPLSAGNVEMFCRLAFLSGGFGRPYVPRGYVFREKVAKGSSMAGSFVVTSERSGLRKNYGKNL
jgi:hypothetical protein